MEIGPIYPWHEGADILRIPVFLLALGLVLPWTSVEAEALSPFPAAVKPLLEARKYNEASLLLYQLIDADQGDGRLPLMKLVYDTDPDLNRLDTAMLAWLNQETEFSQKKWLARNLGNLRLLRRDFQGASLAYDLAGAVPELQLLSGRLYLLLGDHVAAQLRLEAVLASKEPGLAEAAASALAWKLWAEGKAVQAYDAVRHQSGASALGLQCLLARSLGLKKEAQQAREKMRAAWPHSLFFSLVDNDSDPATQMDTALYVLLGIGPTEDGSENRPNPGAQLGDGVVENKNSEEDTPAKGIQVGFFSSPANAKKLVNSLKSKGFSVQLEEEKGNPARWKVMVVIRAGQDAQTILVQLKEAGIEGFLSF